MRRHLDSAREPLSLPLTPRTATDAIGAAILSFGKPVNTLVRYRCAVVQ